MKKICLIVVLCVLTSCSNKDRFQIIEKDSSDIFILDKKTGDLKIINVSNKKSIKYIYDENKFVAEDIKSENLTKKKSK